MADEIVEIVPDGDVVLVVTKAEHTLRFKVHSFFLRAASKVFASLLSANFAEGQALAVAASSVSPCEVTLNDDDPESMKLILNLVHLKHDKSPRRLTSMEVLNFAVLVDKYLLHNAIPLASSKWLMPTKDDDLHLFLQVAMLLQGADSFTETTRLVILYQPTSYSPQTCANQDNFFFHVIIKVDKKREAIRRSTLREFCSVPFSYREEYKCNYVRHIAARLFRNLHDTDLYCSGSRETSLEHGFDVMSRLFDVDEAAAKATCDGNRLYHSHPDPKDMRQEYEKGLKKLMEFSGLCLDCERKEYNGARKGVCKFGHKFKI